MRISLLPNPASAGADNTQAPQQQLPALASPSGADTQAASGRRHHSNSMAFLRLHTGNADAAQATPLTGLTDGLCAAMSATDVLAELKRLLPAAWYQPPPILPGGQVVVRQTWPFTVGECNITQARMDCDAGDGSLQQLHLSCEGLSLDLALLQKKYGQAQASPVYRDGDGGDVQLSFRQPWGRLSVVVDGAQTMCRAILLEPDAVRADP